MGLNLGDKDNERKNARTRGCRYRAVGRWGVNESGPALKEWSTAKLPQVVRKLHGNNFHCGVELKAVESRGHFNGVTTVTYIYTVRRSKSLELL